MNTMKPLSLLSLFLISVFVLDGCEPPSPTMQPAQGMQFPFPTIPPATATPVPTLTLTPAVTDTISPAPTVTVSLPAATHPLPSTPHPTLSPEQAKTLILGFLQDNGQCKLPCIWGFTPGQTDLSALKQSMEQFGDFETSDFSQYYRDYGNLGGLTFIFTKGRSYRFALDYYRNVTGVEQLVLLGEPYGLPLTNGDLEDPEFNRIFAYYALPNILSTYNQPSQVFIHSNHNDSWHLIQPWYQFVFVLVYKEKGFLVAYTARRERVGDAYIGCPLQSYFHITTWTPAQKMTWQDIVLRLTAIGMSNATKDEVRPIEETTTLSVEEFYQKFKDPDVTDCVSTPISLWEQ